MTRNYLVRLAAAALLIPPVTVFATNGYQLIGVGAYQKGMGGAVTARPASAMTAVSNPAGAARIGRRADFSMEAFMPERDVAFSSMGGASADSAVDIYGVPAIGWTAPTSEGSALYFGGGMYGTSGMGVDYASTLVTPGNGTTIPPMYWDGYSNVSFWQMAPVLAWNVDERLSVGAALNIDYQSASFKQRVVDGSNNVINNFDLSRSASGFGYGIGFGLLYDLSRSLTVGASYKSKQEFAPLEYQLAAGDITNGGIALPGGTYQLDLDFPQQAAIGVALRVTPAMTIAADVKWIDWSGTMDHLAVEGPGGIAVPMDPGWSDQTVYALGIDYQVTRQVRLRAGYNYAKAPFGAAQVSRNLLLPAIAETHYTLGGDVQLNNHWELAFHYMYVPEVAMKAPADDALLPGAEIALSESSAGVNIGYRF
ncbi:MAG TPA: outer membrane protein transport protein [Gammaproteobacteria bacterium]